MAGALLIAAWFGISVRSIGHGVAWNPPRRAWLNTCYAIATLLAFGLLIPQTAKSAETVEVSVIVVETQDEAAESRRN